MFPQVETDGSKGTSPWNAHDMSMTFQRLVSAAGLSDGRNYSMHSFRVGGAVSQTLAGTAMDALMAMVGWKIRRVAQRYVGPQPTQQADAVPRSGDRQAIPHGAEERYAAADGLPLQAGFEDQFAAFK